MDSYPIIKYIFLFIFYIFTFVCMFSDDLEIIGFVSAFVVQTIYTIALCFDIFTDQNRNNKLLTFPSVAKKYLGREMSIPLYWFFMPLIIIQYREMLNAVLMLQESYKRWGKLRISRDNRIRLDQFKSVFVANIVLLFLLTIIYMYFAQLSNSAPTKLFFILCFFAGIGLTISNNMNITIISYQMQNTTDGFRVTK
jgi:hypothetical protein